METWNYVQNGPGAYKLWLCRKQGADLFVTKPATRIRGFCAVIRDVAGRPTKIKTGFWSRHRAQQWAEQQYRKRY